MKTKKATIFLSVAALALNVPAALSNDFHAVANNRFYNACYSYVAVQDWTGLQNCAVIFWTAEGAYWAGYAQSKYETIHGPGWDVACPQQAESENPMCGQTYQDYDDAYETATWASGNLDYWVTWM